MNINFNKQIIITTLILIFTIFLFSFTDIDLIVQDYFFNFSTHKWILNRDLQPWKFIFYDGIKKLLIIIAVIFLISLIIFKNISIIKQYKKGIIIVVLSAIFVPLIVASLKKSTNMPCPKNEIHYGGKMIRTAVWQSYQEPYKSMKHISCWPAGHASGGFALLSLFFLFKSRRNKIFALIFGLSVGWMMGLYKMLIGDHFLSHTIITMILAWLIILVIAKIVNKKES
jgi:membrane-associated PAP2 superfamily phosphatase